ncbi:helix-turn-helix transcriptional regulator [Gordonia desulfuricans]|uniref:Helix-turn-helix transcriptional regulator n=1 Tax=Gordonia desulfuricans TaxID=89051 RepID=A0A7K3LK79_9ACTN|nr:MULTISPECIES: metalloregulator ArsR/SmtB family transcription factor [Gordonia]EMP10550.2 ArsR family transcriptional regulator [Gordonia sp. NB41Y]NDK88573.1 helix-turn-helix transcriptional regulator [Gordonia desulfuricans]WLP88844.1 metalloregulator ArsR/SmtB family transcription factor [Gordonia sp. NB41Y]
MSDGTDAHRTPAPDPAGPSLHHPVQPDPDRLAAASSTFGMLADPTRLHLLWLLTTGEFDVTALTEAVGASRTAVSQHLAKLRFTGLVETRRDGRRVIYRIRDGHMTRLIGEAINLADHKITGEPAHE